MRDTEVLQRKAIASLNLARALKSVGFSLKGYHPTKHNPEFEQGTWTGGTATHPAYPGFAVVCDTAQVKTGKFWAIVEDGEAIAQGHGYSKLADTSHSVVDVANQAAKDILDILEARCLGPDVSQVWQCLDGVTVSRNPALNGIEIRFPGIPSETVLDWLKIPSRRYRFSKKGGDARWYIKYTPALLAAAIKYFGLVAEKEEDQAA